MKKEIKVKLIQLCTERNEIDFLYNITKSIAETDSIGEGYGYCSNYSLKHFENELVFTQTKDSYDGTYLGEATLPIYVLYLNQLNIQY